MKTVYHLKERVAIVTGGGKGIGKAISLGLAECGAKVILAARTQSEIEQTAKEIVERGGESTAIVTDISIGQQVQNLVDTAWRTYQRIDILVNNAARSFLRSLFDLREDGWDKIFDTNCKGTFLLSRAVARVMKEQGGGRIINITTVGAVRGGVMMGAYHASKAALRMLTMCMAAEWAPYNINVHAVGPGMTRTHFSQPIWSNPEVERQIVSRIPKGRLANPEEVVGAVLFLCSEEAAFITGQSIYVDGGTLATA